ncbi:ABC transporter ATP-binding protein [Anaeromyxobacter oryzisoli]|uniref:ABC transporter ATP-binding protein n=1 Tax=Anaeromyxobacter oryzisoli TaxID=2925408 RepID=UPI001F562983|nr:ABC transporter ATP-binding protein [Anaeromyxobacter sp. SG63]
MSVALRTLDTRTTAPPHEPASTARPESAVSFAGVTKRFRIAGGGPVVALEEVSLEVRPHEFVCLLGPSGCGKSTLLRMVAGLERPCAGQVTVGGVAVSGPHSSRAMVFQDHALFPWLDVARNVAFGLEMNGTPGPEIRRRVAHFIHLTGLGGFERAYPHQLSGGMKQRVGIARVLALAPEVLLMDEPFGALDAFTRMELQGELVSLWQREPFTTLFVTHDVDEAVFLADRVVVMSRRPGRAKAVLSVNLPRPRRRTDPAFAALRTRVLAQFDAAPALEDWSI